ncbi:MAG: hypothetical protein MI723_04785, partial [Caulobacterales bacterium]|nr:hypothetical protein [Caulobacterales bacterium]
DALEFVGSQFGVFGPLAFVLLWWAVAQAGAAGSPVREKMLLLTAFVVPALAVVTIQAFISRAHANWAAFSYAGGAVLLAVWAVSANRERLLAISVALHVAFGAIFASAGVDPGFADRIGLADAFKRARGWEATTEAVREAFDAGHGGQPYAVIACDNRLLFHGMQFYGRDDPLPLTMWRRYAAPKSHAEQHAPLASPVPGPVLVVSERAREHPKIAADFDRLDPVGAITIDLGGGLTREMTLFAGRGFAPLTRDAAYEERWRDLDDG